MYKPHNRMNGYEILPTRLDISLEPQILQALS